MSFEANKLPEFEHKISDLPDQPNMQPNGLKAYFDANPELLRQALNALCDALSDESAAGCLGFLPTAGIPVTTLQAALEYLHGLLADAVVGKLPTGSVTGDKLAQDVSDRFTAIESAAAAEASTRESTDANLQNQINTKCRFIYGSYTGDDTAARQIVLGCRPKAVWLCTSYGSIYADGSRTYYGGLALDGHPAGNQSQPNFQIIDNGFEVYVNRKSSNNIETNGSSTTYYYIAWV